MGLENTRGVTVLVRTSRIELSVVLGLLGFTLKTRVDMPEVGEGKT